MYDLGSMSDYNGAAYAGIGGAGRASYSFVIETPKTVTIVEKTMPAMTMCHHICYKEISASTSTMYSTTKNLLFHISTLQDQGSQSDSSSFASSFYRRLALDQAVPAAAMAIPWARS